MTKRWKLLLAVLYALGGIGESARDAIPELLKLRNSGPDTVRNAMAPKAQPKWQLP